MRRGFSFSMQPSMDDEDVADISAAVHKVFAAIFARR